MIKQQIQIPFFDNSLCIGGAHFVSSTHQAFLVVINLSTFSLSKTGQFSSPLGIAAEKGHTEVVERLIEAGAIVDYQDKV